MDKLMGGEMHDLAAMLLAVPSWILGAIAGAIGGALGAGIGLLVERRFGFAKAVPLAAAICAVLTFLGGMSGLARLTESTALERTLDALKANRLFALLIRLHPELEPRLRSELQPILLGQSPAQAYLDSQAVTARIVGEYYPPYLLKASDAVLYRTIHQSVGMLTSFEAKPDLCVSYFLGSAQFKEGDVDPGFAERDTGLKADLIESAITNTAPPKPPATAEAILATLTDAYGKSGYPIDDLYKVADVASLPPAEGCRVARQYLSAIASLDQDNAAYIYKSLLALEE